MKLFCVLLLTIISSLKITENVETIMKELDGDALKIATYFQENSDVLNEVNKKLGFNESISGIEKILKVNVLDGKEQYNAYLADFNSDEGYFLLANDYNLLEWEIGVDSPFENINSNNYYKNSSGYLYENENGEILSINDNNNTNSFFETNQNYKGQEDGQTGCGKIKDSDAYVLDKYGSGFSIVRSKSLNYKTSNGQYSLSCYIQNKNGTSYSEGNCGVVSSYNALQALKNNNKLSKLPSGNTYYKAKINESDIYPKYIYNGSNYSDRSSNGIYFPSLYVTVRKKAIERVGKPESLSIWDSARIIESAAETYGYTLDCCTYIDWGFHVDDVPNKIDSNVPSLWSTSNDTYGSHTMCVVGYKYYEKKSSWWIFSSTSTKLFYELSDGHSTASRYYDISDHIGFSGIVIINGV